MADLQALRDEAESAIASASSAGELEELRVSYLGSKSLLTQTLRGIGELPAEERGPVGKTANAVRVALEGLLRGRTEKLEAGKLDAKLAQDRIHVTLPGHPPSP